MYRDEDLDLAVIIPIDSTNKKFAYSKVSDTEPLKGESIFCIGQPSFFDMENCKTGLERSNYPPFYVSEGKVLGYMKDKVYGNKGLGPLIHNCWTYWGHSGSPIFNSKAEIVGIHNSWDDKSGNRHGSSLLSIKKFLEKVKLE